MLTITFTGYGFPEDVPLTIPAIRKGVSGIAVAISGSVSTSDMAAGAVTPAKAQPGAYWYGGSASYAAKTYTANLNPALTGYADGVMVRFKAAADCDDGPISAVINGLTAKVIQKWGGVSLVAGDIRANQVLELIYDASLNSGAGGWLIASDLGNPFNFYGTGGGTGSAHTVTCNVPARSLAALDGRRVTYLATVENSGALTLATDGLTAKPVQRDDGQALVQGDIKVGDLVDVVYVASANAGNGAYLFTRARAATFVGVDAGASDSYACTISGFPGAWITGMRVAFKANTANTGAATLNVTPQGGSALGAVTLKKFAGKDLDTGDILAGQWVSCIYDGTNLQVQSCGDMIASAEQSLRATAGITNIAHGLGVKPRRVRWVLVAQSTTDHNYVTGDEIDVWMAANTTNGNHSLVPVSDSTNVSLLQGCPDTAVTIIDKATPNIAAYTAVTPANWKVKCYYAP